MRKTPRQERSRQMVERIVTAARALLVAEGYDAFSTNRVAAAAGVSPGSLYQYFPDKAAILDVVVEQYWADVADRVVASLGDRLGDLSPMTVRGIADALLAALEPDAALLRVVHEELPRRRLRDQLRFVERRVRELLTASLASLPGVRDARSAPVQAWIVTMAMENLATRWVIDEPDFSRDELLDELVALVMGYLAAPSASA